jgi:hypothetical protein
MTDYVQCPECRGSAETGSRWIYRCEDCNHRYCNRCEILEFGYVYGSTSKCPRCSSSNGVRLGDIIDTQAEQQAQQEHNVWRQSPAGMAYAEERRIAENKRQKRSNSIKSFLLKFVLPVIATVVVGGVLWDYLPANVAAKKEEARRIEHERQLIALRKQEQEQLRQIAAQRQQAEERRKRAEAEELSKRCRTNWFSGKTDCCQPGEKPTTATEIADTATWCCPKGSVPDWVLQVRGSELRQMQCRQLSK